MKVLIIGVLLFIISLILIIRKNKVTKQKKIIQDTSILLKKLYELNQHFNFHWDIQKQYTFQTVLQSKQKFDRYKLDDLFDENILDSNQMLEVSEIVKENSNLYKEYSEKVNCLTSQITEEETKKLHISYVRYKEIEQKLFEHQKLQPIINCNIICIASYTSPKGRNYYSKRAIYSVFEVPTRYEILQKRIKMQNSEQMKRKHVRSQMTDKLRYTILKRDGFRCQICGRTQEDGIKLHVDHIIPVSKGGQTIPNNLRTLCNTCNWGKGDEME